MATFALAERLGVSVAVVDGMTASERNHWLAYFNIRRREQQQRR